jgi:hypothetical protein
MKSNRINWISIPEPRRTELKRIAKKMRAKEFRVQVNYHGAGKWSIDGFGENGAKWIC